LCAPTFEQFAYRFIVESRIWRALHDGRPLVPELDQYLAHYRRS